MTAQANTMWQSRVYGLLRRGLGAEDIAVSLHCAAEDVRREIQILRESGELTRIYKAPKYGATAERLAGDNWQSIGDAASNVVAGVIEKKESAE